MSDDLSMKALGGDFASGPAISLAAGCDVVLHCNGDMAEMPVAVIAGPTSPELSGRPRAAGPRGAGPHRPRARAVRCRRGRRPLRRGLRGAVRWRHEHTFQPNLDFEAATTAAEDGEALIIDLDGYEGPLHVLLALARTQKVDLLQLSITKLAEQYLAFVQQARRVRFSLAADYLVMAAWLAYLKSRLLLPKPERPRPRSRRPRRWPPSWPSAWPSWTPCARPSRP
jgi:hypothetical protein